MAFVSIPDNCLGKTFDYLTLEDKENLQRISDLSLIDILKNDRSKKKVSLVVFPEAIDSLAEQYSSSKILTLDDSSVSTGNIMGFIGLGSTTVKIHSRFDTGVKDYFLYYLLQRVLQINLFDLPHNSSSENIFDFLIMLFPYYLKKAVGQGVLRQYVTLKHNDSEFKGVLDVNRHIKTNLTFNGKIAYNHRLFTTDNPIIQLIGLTINRICRKKFGYELLNSDSQTQACVREIQHSAATYNERESGRIIAQNLRSRIHPYYSEYEPLRKLCLMILKNEEIKYGHEEETIYGILFDGAWLWEEYIGILLKQKFIHYKKNKGKRFYLFAHNGRCFQQIIPDYISKDGLRIGDAKYIPLDKAHNYDDQRATALYYKTITYMYRFNSKEGFLLFPYQGKGTYMNQYSILGLESDASNGILTKLGLSIPKESEYRNYKEFKIKMHNYEEEFIGKL